MIGWETVYEGDRGGRQRSFGYGILAEVCAGRDDEKWSASGAWLLRVTVNDDVLHELLADDRSALFSIGNFLGRDLARRAKSAGVKKGSAW